MNFKYSLEKKNDYNTLSIIIFSIQTLIFYFLGEIERGKRGEREREREREREGSKERKEKGEERERGEERKEKG